MKIVRISSFSHMQTGYQYLQKNIVIQFKYGKIQIRKHLEFHQFLHSGYSYVLKKLIVI